MSHPYRLDKQDKRAPWAGWPSLAVATLILMTLWGFVLPRLSQQSHIRAAQQWIESERLDVSAMFYSELPAVDESLARMRSLHRRNDGLLWSPEEKPKAR